MGHYENGGSNVIGVAVTDNWAAAWTMGHINIHVMPRDFFERNEQFIRARLGEGSIQFSPTGGPSAVDVINTEGDLDGSGAPIGFGSGNCDGYVTHELERWVREFGDSYVKAAKFR